MKNRKGSNNKIDIHRGMKDAYHLYCEKYNNPYNLTQTQYSKVFKEIMEEVMKLVLFENTEIRLLANIGNLRVQKRKIKLKLDDEGNLITRNLRVDWLATNQLWDEDEDSKKSKVLVYHMNDHTDRYNMRFYFDKRTSFIKNQTSYSLLMSRKWKRELAKILKDEKSKIDYFE